MPAGKYIEGVWQEDDCAQWQNRLDQYNKAITALGKEKLVNLDQWYREQLPASILERVPPYITHDELQGIAAWKMHRGSWRERNRQLIAAIPPERVEEVSREAFAAIPDFRKPVAILSTLPGVGPATASAALAAYAPHLYPFFDELVAAFIPGLGPVAFTMPYYLKYASALRERAAMLNASCSDAVATTGAPQRWTAHDVAQALWAVGSSLRT
jgi:hypothetical protein